MKLNEKTMDEIKEDIRNNYNYMTYDFTSWDDENGTVTIVLENYNDSVIIDLTQWNESRGKELDGTEEIRCFVLTTDEFINSSYSELNERMCYCLFY